MTTPVPIRLYVAGVALAGLAAVFALDRVSAEWSVERPWVVAVIACLGAFEALFAVRIQKGPGQAESRGNEEAFLVFAALLLTPTSAFVALAVGFVVGELLMRRGWLKGGFNAALFVGSLAIALVVVDVFGGAGTEVSIRRVGAVVVGAVVFSTLNRTIVSGVLVLAARIPFRDDFLDGLRAAGLLWTGNAAVGILAGLSAHAYAWTLPLAIAAFVALNFGFSGHALAQRQRQQLADVVEWSWDGIFSVDDHGRVELWNPAMEKLTGCGTAAAVGRPVAAVLNLRDDRGAPAREFLAPRDAPVTPDKRLFGLDSHEGRRWLRVSRSPLPDGGFSFIARDITEERSAERALEQSEQRLRLALSAGAMGWWEWDFATDEMRWSESLERVFGLAPRGFGGRYENYVSMIHPDDRAAVESAIESTRAGGRRDLVHRVVRPDGSVRWVEAKGRIVRDAARPSGGMIGVAFDITDRKRLESELLHSQKTEAVGQLAAGLSHDFNNLMSAVIGFSELALGQLHGHDPVRAYVQHVAEAGQRAATMTRQLLAFSRKEGLSPSSVDLNEVVTNMEKLLGPVLGDRVEVEVHGDPELGAIHADPGQIEQILMNLAVNARDAMPDGGRLTVRTANVELDEPSAADTGLTVGRYVVLSLSDTGVGMDEATRSRIFEPFFTTKARGRGTGLGMATVRRIVEESGGGMSLTSVPGAGTTVDVYFPRVEPVESIALVEAAAPSLAGSETILLVEDAEGIRTLERLVLEEHGYIVLEADDGEHAVALAKAREGEIDLLLTDVVMPRLTGPELLDRLSSTRPEVKVLYVSGYAEDELARHGALESGARLLVKPVTPDLLARAVRDTLDAPAPKSRLATAS